jgi:hypothetical protein
MEGEGGCHDSSLAHSLNSMEVEVVEDMDHNDRKGL